MDGFYIGYVTYTYIIKYREKAFSSLIQSICLLYLTIIYTQDIVYHFNDISRIILNTESVSPATTNSIIIF